MIILAIDPGTEKSAFVVWDTEQRKVLDKGIIPNSMMLISCSCGDYDVLSIEMIASYGMPVGKEVFETVRWIGKYEQCAANYKKAAARLVYRKDIKIHFCNSVKAKDANIRQAILDLLGKERTKGVSKDMWSALAVAMYTETIVSALEK
jgi:hypothetical protein